jgi:ASC-1-like (ASCH) protein
MTEHKLKCWEVYYQAIVSGVKKCEIRLNDRGYSVGDTLLLEELSGENGELTGAWFRVRVTHIVEVFIGLRPGYIAMSIEAVPA